MFNILGRLRKIYPFKGEFCTYYRHSVHQTSTLTSIVVNQPFCCFRKDFYIEVPELAKMTDLEVEDYR